MRKFFPADGRDSDGRYGAGQHAALRHLANADDDEIQTEYGTKASRSATVLMDNGDRHDVLVTTKDPLDTRVRNGRARLDTHSQTRNGHYLNSSSTIHDSVAKAIDHAHKVIADVHALRGRGFS